MTKQEYKTGLKQLECEYENRKHNLTIDYVKAHCKFKVGDIYRGSSGRIVEVLGIDAYINHRGIPTVRYYGIVLKGDLTPRPNKEPFYDADPDDGAVLIKAGGNHERQD